MASVTICGYLRTNQNNQIPVRLDSASEGTEVSVGTDSNLTTTSQDVGTYMPGATVTSMEIFCPNMVLYAYLLRQGTILAWGSVNVSGVSNQEIPLSKPVTLRPGDVLRVLPQAAATRKAALCVETTTGVSRIFVGTSSGAGTTDLVDLQDSSNSIGDTLQGSVIQKAMFISIDGSKIVSSGGAWIRNASGQLAGAVPASNPIKADPTPSMVNIPIELNWSASFVTNA